MAAKSCTTGCESLMGSTYQLVQDFAATVGVFFWDLMGIIRDDMGTQWDFFW